MVAWLSWLFDPPAVGPDDPARGPLDELRRLRRRRRRILNNARALRDHGFDTVAQDGEAELKSLDRKILALQRKSTT